MTTLSCDEADALLAMGALSRVEPSDEEALRLHLAECAECAAAARRHTRVATLLALQMEAPEPPPQLRSRIMATVYAEAAAGRGPSSSRLRRLWQRLPRSRTLTAGSAAAVIVLAGVLAWRTATPTVSHVVVTAGQATIDLYSDAQDGTANLEVSRLPSPASGAAVYEVWLLSGHGPARPAAYLVQQPDGTYSAAVTGALSRYTTLAISLEPTRGDPAPQGPIVATVPLSG